MSFGSLFGDFVGGAFESIAPLLLLIELFDHVDDILEIVEWFPGGLCFRVALPLDFVLNLACVSSLLPVCGLVLRPSIFSTT